MKRVLMMLITLGFTTVAHAATPTISNVTGTVSTGQVLTITGANMVQENKTNWDSFFAGGTAYSFEGSSGTSDGYTSYTGDPGATYDSSVKLLGNQSAKFDISSATTCVPNVGNSMMAPLKGNTYWMRGYVRYNVPSGIWPDNHLKLFGAQTNAMLAYIQPASFGSAPTQWVATLNGNPTYVNNPSGAFQNNRWYLVEVNQSASTYTVWIDNQQIMSVPFTQSGTPLDFEIGIINACTTSYPVTDWIDGFTLSSSRIYAASTIEISNSATYGQGTVKYQEPVQLSDGSIQFKADLTGLGSGPYYLWVTNNGQARSAAYNLISGGSTGSVSDTTAPTVSISSPAASSTVSGTVSVAAQAADNVGVTKVEFYVDGALQATDTASTYSFNWDTTLAANGTYTLTATAYDAAGNSATSSPVQVSVNNTSTTTTSPTPTISTTLFQENFADANFASRGWYDNPVATVTTTDHAPGSTSSAQFSFAAGAITPSSGGAMRKQFTATDSVYVSYWEKYSSNWQDQTGGAGHHEIYLLTNQDGAYTNLAFTHLTSYLESWGTAGQSVNTTPHVSFQDGANIDQTKINVDLTQTTENRSVSGCNGLLDSLTATCYNSGNGTYWNGKYLSGGNNIFTLGQWHHVEAYIKMNSIVNGKGVADGTVTYWLDGQQIFQNNNVLMRTGANPTMQFNQFVIAPFMGNGAPINESLWLDDLVVATAKPGTTSLTPPANLKVTQVQ